MAQLHDKYKGLIQLLFVIGFVVLSVSISRGLHSDKPTLAGNNNPDRSLVVDIATLAPAPHQIQFTTTGTIASLTDIAVVPQVSGQIVAFNSQFFQGGEFAKDEILFAIDPSDYQLEVERLAAEVARAETGLFLEKAESTAAISEWQQFNGDTRAPDLVARRPQLAEAKANLRAAKAQLRNAQLDLARTQISMPFNGRVLSSVVARGRFVNAGESVAQVFDKDTLEVRSSLTDQQLRWLLEEDNVDITLTVTHLGETRDYRGFLKRSLSAVDPTTRFVTTSFGFVDTDGLLPGLFVTIQVASALLQNIVKIPTSAVQKNNVIWAVDSNSQLVQIAPDIIYIDDSYLAVAGLESTVNIVTSRLDGGITGMRVLNSATLGDAP